MKSFNIIKIILISINLINDWVYGSPIVQLKNGVSIKGVNSTYNGVFYSEYHSTARGEFEI